MSIDRFLSGYKTLESVVGLNWIDKELAKILKEGTQNQEFIDKEKQFHPLAVMIYYAQLQMIKSIDRNLFQTDINGLRLAYLGERIGNLIKYKVEGIEKKIEELRSANGEYFEKIYYEIQVAAAYVEKGHKVEFVKTNPKIYSHDLLVEDVEIECTKKDAKDTPSSEVGSSTRYVSSIVASVKKKRLQLSGARPAIVYVHLNGLQKDMVKNDFDLMDEELRKILDKSRSINAVVLSAEFFEDTSNMLTYSHDTRILKNQNPKKPLPKGFSIIGDYS